MGALNWSARRTETVEPRGSPAENDKEWERFKWHVEHETAPATVRAELNLTWDQYFGFYQKTGDLPPPLHKLTPGDFLFKEWRQDLLQQPGWEMAADGWRFNGHWTFKQFGGVDGQYPSFGTDYTWQPGAGAGVWNAAASWGGGGIPNTNADKAIFAGTDTKACSVDVNITVGEIDVQSGYTSTITQAATMTVDDAGAHNGKHTISDGTWDPATYDWSADGIVTVAGTVTAATGTPTHALSGGIFISASTANYDGGTATVNAEWFHADAVASTIDLTSNTMTLSGDAGVGEGMVEGYNFIIYAANNFTHSNGNVTITFTGSTLFYVQKNLYDLVQNGSGGNVQLETSLVVGNDFNIINGTWDTKGIDNHSLTVINDMTVTDTFVPQASTVTCSGNWDSSAGTITNGHLDWSLVLDGSGSPTLTVSNGQNFFNLTCGTNAQQTVTVPGANQDLDIFGLLTVNSNGITDGATNADIVIQKPITPVLNSTDFSNIYRIIYQSTTAITATVTTYNVIRIANNTPVTLGGNTIANVDVLIDSGSTLTSDGYNITTKTVTNSGTLTLDTNAGRQTTLTFSDTAGAGFGSSTGTLICSGLVAQGITITSAATPPSTYYAFSTTMDITADYTTFEYYNNGGISGIIDIDNCTFQNNNTGNGLDVTGTVTSFTNNTFDTISGTQVMYVRKAHTAFDNIMITNNSATKSIVAVNVTLEFTNSNFDITNVNLQTSGNIISKNHNDVSGDYYIAATTVLQSNITNQAAASDDKYLVSGEWGIDEAETWTSGDFIATDVSGIHLNVTAALTASSMTFKGATVSPTNPWDLTMAAAVKEDIRDCILQDFNLTADSSLELVRCIAARYMLESGATIAMIQIGHSFAPSDFFDDLVGDKPPADNHLWGGGLGA